MTASRGQLLRVLACVVAASLPVLFDPGAIERAAALGFSSGGYAPVASAGSGLLLYLWLPVVVLSSFALVLGPGLMLALGLGMARSAAQWLLIGLAGSTVLLSIGVEVCEAMRGAPLSARGFGFLALGVTIATAVVSWWVGKPRGDAARHSTDWQTLLSAALVPLLVLTALLPKFLWESFNGDGAHAFEAARLLLHQPVPFWSPEAGAMSNYPGVTTALSTFAVSWFVRLFGAIEASARLPYLLFVSAGLFAGLMSLIEVGRTERTSPKVPWLVWAGLIGFTLAMAFSATHNPYHADIALPGAQDALLMGWFLGFAVAFLEGRVGLMALFGLLTYTTSPAGAILLGLWILAAAALLRPMPRGVLGRAILVVIGCVVLAKAVPYLVEASGYAGPGGEHEAGNLAHRLLDLQFLDWRRLLFVLVPGGILPALSVLAWRRLDPVGRTVAAVAVVEFLFFYFQRRTSLHYFVPAMVLPIVTCWRLWQDGYGTRWMPPVAVLLAGFATVVSLPENLQPHTAAREVGSRLAILDSDYARSGPAAFRRSELLSQLFPRDRGPGVPEQAYGGSPLSWLYYGFHAPGDSPAYVLQPSRNPGPEAGRLIATEGDATLWVVNEEMLMHDRGLRLPHGIARIYHLNKHSDHTR